MSCVRRLRRLPAAALALLGAWMALAPPASAQPAGAPEQEGPVSLVADSVRYDTDTGRLVAEGNVEVYYGDRTLTASRIVYDRPADRLEATGPLTLRGPEAVTLLASSAELDARLRDGIIQGAQAVMQDDVKFAAAEGRRIDGRYNVLSRAVFSPCRVCPESPTPLWRIRADRIVHDEQSRTVFYENATFDIFGQPVFWTPYFRHPDPTLRRASGFLPPEYRRSTLYGNALRQPYYWVIDDQTDATLAPIVTTRDGLILDGEFRRAFTRGSIALQGSATVQDYDGEEKLRGHIFGQGLYLLGDGFETGFSLEQASDDAYLRRYDFTEIDRLESELFLRHSDTQGWGEVSIVRFQSLRDDEPVGQIPFAAPAFEGRREWAGPLGGEFGLDLAGYAIKRTGGQDTAHGALALDWEKSWIAASGLRFAAYGAVQGDAWRVQDAPGDDNRTRLAPLAALEARYPLLRLDEAGDALTPLLGGGAVTHVLEPIAQAVIAPYLDDDPDFPNEDSRIVEFDETSLFDYRRHSGFDGFEEGPRLNLGLRYARIAEGGAQLSVAAGRVFRPKDIGSFPTGVGLNDAQSDYVAAWTVDIPGIIEFSNRLRVDDDLDINRNEVYATASIRGLDVAGSYVYLAQDAVTPDDRHEVNVESRYALTRNWYVGAEARRDLEADSWIRTEGLVGFANECVDLAAYVGRRYTETDDVPASTYFGIRVNLWGLGGAPGPAAPAGECAVRLE